MREGWLKRPSGRLRHAPCDFLARDGRRAVHHFRKRYAARIHLAVGGKYSAMGRFRQVTQISTRTKKAVHCNVEDSREGRASLPPKNESRDMWRCQVS